METTQKIILLNKMRFTSKNDKKMCKVTFVIYDMSDNDNFTGYNTISEFYNYETFEKFPKSWFMQVINGTFTEKLDYKNPLKKSYRLTGIDYEEDFINLV